MVTGVRKVAFDQRMVLTWDQLVNCPLTYEDIGFTAAKGRQLERIYWPQEDFQAAIEKLRSRVSKPHSSVAVQMASGVKDSRSQGYCLQNMVITQTPKHLHIDIFYRSTEAIAKFLADLIFFSRKLPPLFDRKPTHITFHFANSYVSALFAPILLRYHSKPLDFFIQVSKEDPKFFRTFGLSTRRNFGDINPYSYRTRSKMWDYQHQFINLKSHKMLPVVRLLTGLTGEIVDDDDDEV